MSAGYCLQESLCRLNPLYKAAYDNEHIQFTLNIQRCKTCGFREPTVISKSEILANSLKSFKSAELAPKDPWLAPFFKSHFDSSQGKHIVETNFSLYEYFRFYNPCEMRPMGKR